VTLNEHGKKLVYAVLWIDDAGSASLPRDSVNWYHKNAGPMSFAVEIDDRYPWSFNKLLKNRSIDLAFDYLSHHHHSIQWRGNRLIKWIYNSTKLYWGLYTFLQLLSFSTLHPIQLHFVLIVFGSVLFALGYFLYPYDIRISALLLMTLFFLALMAFTWFYVRLSRNWKMMLLDTEWNKEFLQRVRKTFEDKGFEYPAIIRHGWNVSLPHMMKFYMKELGVIADWSPTPTKEEYDACIDNVRIVWKNREPYYAGLSQGYEVEWDGEDEEDRGLLMLPVTLGDIAVYGFGEREKKLIKEVPDGGLVSAYIHPVDNFKSIINWVNYLKRFFDVRFITAEEYTRIFMKKRPRPMLIDRNFRVHWTFKENGHFYPIREVDRDTVSLEVIGHNYNLTKLKLMVATENPIPEVFVQLTKVKPMVGSLNPEQKNDGTVLRMVKPGIYILHAHV